MNEKKTRNRKAKEPYCCIRCDYTTVQKTDMRKHLFDLKKPCPATKNVIELTPEIKSHILDNRIYKIPKPEKEEKPKTIYQTITNNIQNNNTMNNYLNSLDIEDKFKKYIEYSNTDVLPIEFAIEEKNLKIIKKLKNDKYKYGMHLDQDAILNIVDIISKVSDNFEDFNVLYDTEYKKIKLYSKSWCPYLVEAGVKRLVELIQDSYLYAYEMYLIKKIYDGKMTNYPELIKYKNSLEEYYKFMNIFGVQPYCVDKTDDDIIGNNSNTYEIQDKIHKIYNTVDEKTTKGETTKLKKAVLDIIKSNSKHNIKELNKKVMELLKMNEEFKEDLLKDLEINEEPNKNAEIPKISNEIIETL